MSGRQLGILGVAIATVLALPAVTGCSGDAGEIKPVAPLTAASPLPDALIDASWPMQLATQAEQDKLTSVEGWVPLIIQRNYRTATKQLGMGGGLPGARAHADASAMYRQAAMVMAWSFLVTYEQNPAETDPVGTAHLLSVSHALMGDLVKAREYSAKLNGVTDVTTPWHEPWRLWLAQPNPVWPPDLSTLPLGFPAPVGGENPDLPMMPHYSMPEQAGATTSLDMADPGALVALAMWHDTVAHQLAGTQGAAVDTYLVRYRFPGEPDVVGVDLPPEFLVASDYLVPADGPFMADLLGAGGVGAIETHSGTSLLAAIAAQSRVDGVFKAELAGNHAAALRETMLVKLNAKNGGADLAPHRTFANIVYVGTMRSLAFVPEVEDRRESEESGKLRILAMEKADEKEETACPAGLMSLAAWDAGNGYTLRGAEIIHDAIRRYPATEASRYALDVWALRQNGLGPKIGPQQ